jgi:hypothetical protein
MWTQKRFFQTYFVILLKNGKKLTRYVLWDNKKLKLNRNFKRVNDEVKAMINELLGKTSNE